MTDAATAWTTVYLQHRAALQAYAYALTGQPEPAADLLQDVLLKVIRTGSPAEDPKAYLLRSLRNLAIDRSRARSVQPGPLEVDAVAALEPDPLVRSEELELLRVGLGKLTCPCDEIVVLKTFTQCTFAEIAEIMELPAGTVASHYRRGLAQLRSIFTEKDGETRTTGRLADRRANPPASSGT